MFTGNGKRHIASRDPAFSFLAGLIHRNYLGQFLSYYFLIWETVNCYVILNLSNGFLISIDFLCTHSFQLTSHKPCTLSLDIPMFKHNLILEIRKSQDLAKDFDEIAWFSDVRGRSQSLSLLSLSRIKLSKPFTVAFPRRDLYKVDRAPLNMNSKVFFRRKTAVWTVKTLRKRISSHLKNAFKVQLSRYGINSSASKTCFALKITLAFEIHWVMFFLLRFLLLPSPSSLLALNFKSAFSLQRFFGVKSSPARIYSRRSCVCCSLPFAWEIAWDSPLVNIVSQTINKQVSSSWILWTLMGNSF